MTKHVVIVDSCGTRRWYNESNELHRIDGPAVECIDGTKSWYLNGSYHRIDGPAVEYSHGEKLWFLHGVELTESEFFDKTKKASCENKVVKVDGVTHKYAVCLIIKQIESDDDINTVDGAILSSHNTMQQALDELTDVVSDYDGARARRSVRRLHDVF